MQRTLCRTTPPRPLTFDDPPDSPPRKFHVDGGQVEIIHHLVYELDADGKQLSCRQLTDYTGDKLRSLYPDATELRRDWLDPDRRAEIIERLADQGIDLDSLAETVGKPEADLFDLLCHYAYNLPFRTRRERAERLRREESTFLHQFGPEASQVLDALIEKYAEHAAPNSSCRKCWKCRPLTSGATSLSWLRALAAAVSCALRSTTCNVGYMQPEGKEQRA